MTFLQKALKRIGFWFPILLSIFIYGEHIDTYTIYGNVILALTIILACNLFYYKKKASLFEIIGVLFFNIIMFVQIAHFYLFNDNIKSSTLFIIFESNSNETLDFLSMYIDLKLTLILASTTLITLISLFFITKNTTRKIGVKFNIIALLIVFISLSNHKIRANTFPYTVYRAIDNYLVNKKKLDEITQDRFGGDFSEVEHINNKDNETYVLIIGESTTKNHMQLYNYYRNTNPKLNKIKDELIIYNNVISPHTHTITSLEKVLTLASHNFPDKKYNGSLIQLFNKAGFKTYWISNQNPMGISETTTTIISNNCDEQVFINTSSSSNESLDEKILKPFNNVLKQKFSKKLIIIHLMGTHGKYSDRYPISFQKFSNTPKTKFNHKKAFNSINSYDNAILYNDFVISKIIEDTKQSNLNSFVLYFSDHGEDVYETIDIACHTETKGTKPMYDIPFVLWRSEKFKQNKNEFIFDVNRKLSTENLIYTLSDLSNIKFKEFDPTKSIINKKFIQRERILSNNIDYDIFFNSKKQ